LPPARFDPVLSGFYPDKYYLELEVGKYELCRSCHSMEKVLMERNR